MGTAHGAINMMIVLYDAPVDEWEMKQFPTRRALEQFAADNRLLIVEGEKE